jgi:hypothetical protein
MTEEAPPPERPRVEPEIIPPGRGRESDWRQSPWRGDSFAQARGTSRIYVTRLGPFGIALVLLAIAAIFVLFMIALLGVVLLWIPIIVVAVVLAAVLRRLRW